MTAVLDSATTTTTTTATTVDASPTPARTDRRGSPGLARLLVAGPALLALSVAIHPDDAHGAARTLTAIGGDDKARWILVHLLEPFSWLLLGVALLFALPRLAPGKGRRLAAPAGVLGLIGAVSIGFIVYSHGEAFVFMTNTHLPHGVYTSLFDQYEKTGFPLAAIPSLAYRLAMVLGAVGLFRARTIPRWAAVLLGISALTFGGAMGDAPIAVVIVMAIGPLLAATIGAYRTIATTGGPAFPGTTR